MKLPNLEVLTLVGCNGIDDEALCSVKKDCSKSLQVIILIGHFDFFSLEKIGHFDFFFSRKIGHFDPPVTNASPSFHTNNIFLKSFLHQNTIRS
jgi:hypothetical protein